LTTDTASDFHHLTRTGQLRRLARLAAHALTAYDLRVESLRLHTFATNLLYRVRTTSGERYMLRLASPGWRTREDLLAEAAWLEALQRDTDLGAPAVVRASSGETVLPMTGLGVPSTWHTTLMTWVDGQFLAHHLTEANLERMGELFARLHLHAASWQPPAGFSQRRFEAFLSRGEPDVLFSAEVLQTLREDDHRALLVAREWVERAYAELDRGDLRVIHCDLWHENIKLDRGRLRPFDFEDTIWGYRLHDLAMGMLDLLETVGSARYAVLLAAVRRGYERLLAWPQGNLEVLQIGRLLWMANWVARFEREELGGTIQRYGAVVRRFEETGVLRLPEPGPKAQA
jgi:Ser/Thr protein kinase RdoA (MazF antagonist)